MRYLVVVSLLLVGCVTRYHAPEDSQPHATLRAVWVPIADLNFGGYQVYSVLDHECQRADDGKQLGVVAATPGVEEERTFRLHAGREHLLYVRGTGSRVAPLNNCAGPAQVCIAHPACINLLAVSLEAGKSYEIKQVHSGERCTTMLTEAGTNRRPPTLRHVAVGELACRREK